MFNLFIYGTLLQAENPFGNYLKNNSEFVSYGKFNGTLFNLGEYPGARHESQCDTYVFGSILSLNHPTEALRLMDEYEGFGTEQAQPNEFVRELIDIETESGKVRCWVYLYNLSVEKALKIIGGNYLDFILETT